MLNPADCMSLRVVIALTQLSKSSHQPLLYLNGSPTRTSHRAQGTLLDVMWEPGWEGSLGENAYMCMCG